VSHFEVTDRSKPINKPYSRKQGLCGPTQECSSLNISIPFIVFVKYIDISVEQLKRSVLVLEPKETNNIGSRDLGIYL